MNENHMREKRPRWVRQLEHYLAVCPMMIINGNVRDSHLVPSEHGLILRPTIDAIWETLQANEYEMMLVYDPVDGLRATPAEAIEARGGKLEGGGRQVEIPAKAEGEAITATQLDETMRTVMAARDTRCALVLDYAARMVKNPTSPAGPAYNTMMIAQKLAHTARELRGGRDMPYNPLIWVTESAQEVPSWMSAGSDRIHTITAAVPDRTQRHDAAIALRAGLAGDPEREDEFAEDFADLTDGLTLRAMSQIATIARRERINRENIADAVRCYKVGISENPWTQSYLRAKVANAEERFRERVKGQDVAVKQALDILKRSVTGLSGAQAGRNTRRPRGVFFLAGPTGVGKTELAKAITTVLFDDEDACVRLDMSEYASEHSRERLIGAPPSYVGYEKGGELTNAVRERPFCVLLLDEIEKAHHRIFDVLLQLLDEGRVTDSHGSTVYFSECIVVMTSNLGIYRVDQHGERTEEVNPSQSYEEIRDRVTERIRDFFRFDLNRPEILNRIGENIVVFDFIRNDVAVQIFRKMIGHVAERVGESQDIEIGMAEGAIRTLGHLCCRELSNGGRGIGNQIEKHLINPLAREIFRHQAEGTAKPQMTVSEVRETEIVLT